MWLLCFIFAGALGAFGQTTIFNFDQQEQPSPKVQVTAGPAAQCSMKKLNFTSNGVPDPNTADENSVWGGRAAYYGNASLFQDDYLTKLRAARRRVPNVTTMAYLEGPCGMTGGSDPDNEVGKCRNKFQNYNRNNPAEARGYADTTGSRWIPYTLAQLKATKIHKIDLCEIDNLDNASNVIEFFKTYKRLFDAGEIYCRLVLKNDPPFSAIRSQIGTGAALDFISNLHIKEVGGNGCNSGRGDHSAAQANAMRTFGSLKGTRVQTLLSRDTCNYQSSNFSQELFLACRGGRQPGPARAGEGDPAAAR